MAEYLQVATDKKFKIFQRCVRNLLIDLLILYLTWSDVVDQQNKYSRMSFTNIHISLCRIENAKLEYKEIKAVAILRCLYPQIVHVWCVKM